MQEPVHFGHIVLADSTFVIHAGLVIWFTNNAIGKDLNITCMKNVMMFQLVGRDGQLFMSLTLARFPILSRWVNDPKRPHHAEQRIKFCSARQFCCVFPVNVLNCHSTGASALRPSCELGSASCQELIGCCHLDKTIRRQTSSVLLPWLTLSFDADVRKWSGHPCHCIYLIVSGISPRLVELDAVNCIVSNFCLSEVCTPLAPPFRFSLFIGSLQCAVKAWWKLRFFLTSRSTYRYHMGPPGFIPWSI